MKRILAILLTVASVLSANITTYATDIYTDVKDASLYEATDFLYEFGIMYGYDDDTFLPDKTLTRAEFAVCIARMLGLDEQAGSDKSYFIDMPSDHWAAGSVAQLVERGIFSGYGAGYFGTNDEVKTIDALKVLTILLGYGNVAESDGGYPDGYRKAAQKADILEDIAMDTMLSRGDAAKLFFNTMNAMVAVTDWTGAEYVFEESDETFLEHYRNIVVMEGTVTEVSNTSIYSVGRFKNVIGLEGHTYDAADGVNTDNSVLGKYVTAYCKKHKDDEYTVLYYYIHENKTEEITISSEDIIKEKITEGKFVYSDGDRERTIKIPNNAVIIYNGVYADTYTLDIFKIDSGEIRFLKMRGADDYNLIFIDDVESVVVSSVEENNEIINFKGSKVLKFEDFDKVVIKDVENGEISLSQIKPDMVLSVKNSYPYLLEIVVCSNVVNGKIESLNNSGDEETVVIDGTEYSVTSDYAVQFFSEFSINTNITAYLDMYGKIAFAEKINKADSYLFGYLINARYSESNDVLLFKIFTKDSELARFEAVENIRIDGKRFKEKMEAYSSFVNNAEQNKPQIVVYRLDEENKLTYLDTLYKNTDAKEDDYTLSVSLPEDTYHLRTVGTIGRMGIFKNDAVIFAVPSANKVETADENDFTVHTVKSFCTYVDRNLETYKLSPSIAYETVAVTKAQEAGISSNYDSYVVSEIIQTINEYDEPITQIRMYGITGPVTMNAREDCKIPVGLKRGDVIAVAKDFKERIYQIQIRHNGDDIIYNANNNSEKSGGLSLTIHGRVESKDGEILRLSYASPSDAGESQWKTVAKVGKIIVYDKKEDEIYLGDVDDVKSFEDSGTRCSEVIAEYGWDGIDNIIIINN